VSIPRQREYGREDRVRYAESTRGRLCKCGKLKAKGWLTQPFRLVKLTRLLCERTGLRAHGQMLSHTWL
jgi:hypothetical protein